MNKYLDFPILKNNYKQVVLIVFCFTLGLPWVMMFKISIGLLSLTLINKFDKNIWRRDFFVFTIFYLWFIISITINDTFFSNTKYIIRYLPFLLTPFICYGVLKNQNISKPLLEKCKLYFSYGLVFTIIYGYLFTSIDFILEKEQSEWLKHITKNKLNLFYHVFTLKVKFHQTYLALYCLIASVFLLTLRLNSQTSLIIHRALGVLVLMHPLLIQSRIGVLLTFIGIIYVVIVKKKPYLMMIFIIVLVSILIINPNVFHRIQEFSLGRYEIWKTTLYLIKENSIFGIGPNEVKVEITEHLRLLGDKQAARRTLNAHNQFLEVFLALGGGGFLIFLCIVYKIIKISINQIKEDSFIFLNSIFLILSFLIESMLNRERGIFILLFIIMIIVIQSEVLRKKNL